MAKIVLMWVEERGGGGVVVPGGRCVCVEGRVGDGCGEGGGELHFMNLRKVVLGVSHSMWGSKLLDLFHCCALRRDM